MCNWWCSAGNVVFAAYISLAEKQTQDTEFYTICKQTWAQKDPVAMQDSVSPHFHGDRQMELASYTGASLTSLED